MKQTQSLLPTLLIISMCLFGCQAIQLARFYVSENHQQPRQETHNIRHRPDQTFSFFHTAGKYQQFIDTISFLPSPFKNKKNQTYRLGEYLDQETKTTALLVIRRDTIVYERYFEGYDEQSLLPSFSVAKSFTSALMGIAIQEGKIDKVSDLVVTYLPELKELHPYWNLMTIEDLLNMRSGIEFNEDSYVNPYSDISDLYMAKDVMKVLKKAQFQARPGERHYYSSLDTEILGLILERAIDTSLAAYLQDKVWHPCGMESDAAWSIDSKASNHSKAFCCITAVARDFARFGRLYLHYGNWHGQQVIDSSWIANSRLPNFANNCYQYQWYSKNRGMKSFKDSTGAYQALTFADSVAASTYIEHSSFESVQRHRSQNDQWIIQQCGPGFYALGIFGQEIYIDPESEMIFVRLGKKWDTPNQWIFWVIQDALKRSGSR